MASPESRLSVRERTWLPLEFIRTVGPLQEVTAEGLRAALTGLHAGDPTHRAVCRLDRARASWVHLGPTEFTAFSAGAVTAVPGAPNQDDLTLRLLAEPPGAHPVRILVGGGFVALKIAHAYGDAGPVNDLLRELVQAAAQGRAARFPSAAPARLLLTSALWRQFGRHPRRLPGALRITRAPADQPAAADDGAPWRPDITTRTARSAQVLATMRTWRDTHAPGVTTSAITFAAFAAALRDLRLDPELSGAVFLADARRYLRPGTSVDGDFCWGQYLAPVDLLDPRAVHTALKAELASGRMLAMMAMREARVALTGPGGRIEHPARLAGRPRPQLTFSNQGRHDILADLPWAAPPQHRVNLSVPTQSGAAGITLTTSEMGGVLHLEATFHRSSYDPATIARALGVVCADPAALLMATR